MHLSLQRRWRSPAPRRGAALVEVMTATILLGILAIGAASSLHYARGMAGIQKNRRTAMEIAGGRLEEVRASAYSAVSPSASNYTTYYLSRTGTVWVRSSSDPNEQAIVNGRPRPMRTTVQYVDADGGSASYDCVRVAVRVQYGRKADEIVGAETLKSP